MYRACRQSGSPWKIPGRGPPLRLALVVCPIFNGEEPFEVGAVRRYLDALHFGLRLLRFTLTHITMPPQVTIWKGMSPMSKYFAPVLAIALLLVGSPLFAQTTQKFDQEDKFRQLEETWPTPNDYRTGSGAPGHAYWQQTADYEIDVTLDDVQRRIVGSEKITYHNHSPDTLTYLWLQLDPNIHRPASDANSSRHFFSGERMDFDGLRRLLERGQFDGGANITAVRNPANGNDLAHVIVRTMMRVDLPQPLRPGEQFTFQIDWNYHINNAREVGGRSGYEHFAADDNCIYEIAQWFPRMCAYIDNIGWQHKQFLGMGEFTLEFGDYMVRITAPADHIVVASGQLMNPQDVLTADQRARLEQARTAERPVFVVTPEEAKANEKSRASESKTWVFHAKRVRDFAFASSRKFIWDAQVHEVEGNSVLAMSAYPNEAEPLWSKYSTQAIIHTLNVYSKFSFPYPYPVAISVNGPVGGMEYPMICFNGPRPEPDGTYSADTKYGLISVVIHEVGHNYFPMIVNSDERQWTWMDEGLNTFLQYLAEKEWEDNYPSWTGEPQSIADYMRSENQVPIMTNSESLLQFGPNAYFKPATGLNILRETILGRELFDYAFREYARRWQFKRPMPADFFRTMEDASGVDLDWFWRGWFYSTDHVDLAIASVRQFNVDTQNPAVEKGLQRADRDAQPRTFSQERNESLIKRIHQIPELVDFYNSYDPLAVTPQDEQAYQALLAGLSEQERALLNTSANFYVIEFKNEGGMVMPIIFEIVYDDDSRETVRVPVDVWARDNQTARKLVVASRQIKQITLDPRRETADADLTDNYYPPQMPKSRFQLFKQSRGGGGNPMQQSSATGGSQ